MSSRRTQGDTLLVALGISAIDLLCCAMVSGLVMFLVLSSPGRKAEEGIAVGDSPGLKIRYVPRTPDEILALRFVNRRNPSEHVEFYSSDAEPSHLVTNPQPVPLVGATGTVFEHVENATTPHGAAQPEYFYIIRGIRPADWDVFLTYADSHHELAATIASSVQVDVDVSGSCSVRLQCNIGVGESASLTSAACRKQSTNPCDAAQIIAALARPANQSRQP